MAAMGLLKHLPRSRPSLYGHCGRTQLNGPHCPRRGFWAAPDPNQEKYWKEQARQIRSGSRKSMVTVLEERGLVKDIAGGRDALDWLLTEKPVGAYVGVDPTAPSLHVGHLLPLMALFWMYLSGYATITLVGTGTVQIGDPSGRMTARARLDTKSQPLNEMSMTDQLARLWRNVVALGVKHGFSGDIGRQRHTLQNHQWLRHLPAMRLMETLGSGMRLTEMLNRDSVRARLESGNGMSLAEFCYPLFQGYDWWHMYKTYGVQLQLGGSDQYGNICAGMEAVEIMRKTEGTPDQLNNPRRATYGITTPLLTTASGEKFGKSAGNAVWLDNDMLSSFDLYQYFLGTADGDVERYLKIFTFLRLDEISLLMNAHVQDPSKRVAQHALAKEVVELAHGAYAAKCAASEHKESFGAGANVYNYTLLKNQLHLASKLQGKPASHHNGTWIRDKRGKRLDDKIVDYKKQFAAGSSKGGAESESSGRVASNMVTLPKELFEEGSTFPRLMYAAGVTSSKGVAHRLILSGGAYVVDPQSGSPANPSILDWRRIDQGDEPHKFIINNEALVLRSGKTKIRVCRIMDTKEFRTRALTCPGWEDAQRRKPADVANEKTSQETSQETSQDTLADEETTQDMNEEPTQDMPANEMAQQETMPKEDASEGGKN